MKDAYYSQPEVSNSDLTALKKGNLPLEQVIEIERAYRFGRLIDAMITEPELVDYYTFRVGEDQYTHDEFEQAKAMKASFQKDPFCATILKQSECQRQMTKHGKGFTHNGDSFELDVRCKWDLWMPAMNWGGDIKSTTAVSQKQFEEAARYFDYDRQRAWYMDIAGSNRDILIGISKKNFQVFKLPINRGDRHYNAGKSKYEELAHLYYHTKIKSMATIAA